MFVFLFSLFIGFLVAIFVGIFEDIESKKQKYKNQYLNRQIRKKKLITDKIINDANKVLDKQKLRPDFIKEVGNYLITFPLWSKINYHELEEKFKNYNQDLPNIFELNDYLHTINFEVAFSNFCYILVPVGTIDLETLKKEKHL